jgi:AcrR family transcriptional regulator
MSEQAESSYHHGNLRDEILTRAAEIIGEDGIEALSLRRIARDLGVSHGAPNRHFKTKAELLAELGAEAWFRARDAMLLAVEKTGSDNPQIRLNAMGRSFLKWALNHRPFLAVIQHPDITRHTTEQLNKAMAEFRDLLRTTVEETQAAGRHPTVNTALLTLYTNSVPYGLALLLQDPEASDTLPPEAEDEVIAELIELVVPIKQCQS